MPTLDVEYLSEEDFLGLLKKSVLLKFRPLSDFHELNDYDYSSSQSIPDAFYVILGNKDALADTNFSYRRSFRIVLEEIDGIKERHLYIERNGEYSPDTLPKGLPKPGKLPILVCGFLEDLGVRYQMDSLREAGYEAYISKEGTCRVID